MPLPSREQLEAIKRWDVPTVSNAIETFQIRPQTEGFCDTTIQCFFPQMGRMIGYAATAQCSGTAPDSHGQGDRVRHWREVLKIPEPRVVVVEDLDPPPRQGALFGEVNSNLHRALGCVGLVTNGSVRDIDEVEALGFHYFARSVCSTHMYVHYVSTATPVAIGGLEVHPGDLLYGDKHGVISIPLEIAALIPKRCEEIMKGEKVIVDYCQSSEFQPSGLEERFKAFLNQKY